MILQSQNHHFCLSRTVSVLQRNLLLKSIFMDKSGKPSSEIWKDVHISLLATVRRWKQIYSLQNKKKAQNLQERGKNAYFWLVADKLLLTSQNI